HRDKLVTLFTAAPLLGGLFLGWLTGGDIGNIGRLRFKAPRLSLVVICVTALVRVAAGYTQLGTLDGVRYLYVLCILMLLIVTLLQWRALPGIWLGSVGLGLNLVVTLANHGHMPVSPLSG